MQNDKMKILKMLEEGKITTDDAAKLLDSISNNTPNKASSSTYSKEYTNNNDDGAYKNPSHYPGLGLDEFATRLGRKVNVLAKDLEPKIKKFTDVVAEKTTTLADKISKSLDNTEKSHPSGTTPYNQRNFEIIVTPESELSLSSYNGYLKVKGYNGDKITIKVNCTTIKPNAQMTLSSFENKYMLVYSETEFKYVSIDAFVPESLFNLVNFSSINGLMDISTIKTKYFTSECLNKDVTIKDISCETLCIENSCGKLTTENVTATNGKIENSNGKIIVNHTNIINMKLSTSNDEIIINGGFFNENSNYIWSIDTNNAVITLNLPSTPDIGYHIKAETVLGNVKIAIPSMNYISNNATNAEAISFNYNTCTKKIQIDSQTSNGNINIC